jgi:NAD(P)-dependent dehydrogenase (short-subunit alcohol dehydrogenase family)
MNSPAANSFSLVDKRAIITGGGTGLGFGMARCFIASGAQVVLLGRREDVLGRAATDLGPQATYRVHDITRFDENHTLLANLEESQGPIDILINNAGNHFKKPFLDTTEIEFQSVLDTHLTGSFSLSRAVANKMVDRGRGSILFVSSMAAGMGVPYILAYTAAKTACAGMVRGLAAELASNGIRVNGIVPGWIDTSMTQQAFENDPARKDRVLSRTPMNRLGELDDIGWAAVYLSSDAAKFVTGSMLTVDGGASIGF